MQGDVIHVILLVTDVFEKMHIPYAVCGSISSSVHGVMRSTMNVDIVANMRVEHISGFIEELSTAFYADAEMIRDAINCHSSFNLIHLTTAYKVDVFIPKQRAFDRMQLERRVATLIIAEPEKAVYVTSPEDIILSKLEWYRMDNEASDRSGQRCCSSRSLRNRTHRRAARRAEPMSSRKLPAAGWAVHSGPSNQIPRDALNAKWLAAIFLTTPTKVNRFDIWF